MSIDLFSSLFILTCHYMADFVFQSNKMAMNKNRSTKWLLIHVSVYSFTVLIASILLMTSIKQVLLFVGINFILHFIVDFITSRMTAYFTREEKRRPFFLTIGADQLIHTFCLLISFCMITKNF